MEEEEEEEEEGAAGVSRRLPRTPRPHHEGEGRRAKGEWRTKSSSEAAASPCPAAEPRARLSSRMTAHLEYVWARVSRWGPSLLPSLSKCQHSVSSLMLVTRCVKATHALFV